MALRTRHGEDFWRKHDQAWARSGLTQVAYCAEHRIRLGSFVRWRSRLLRTDPGTVGSQKHEVQPTLVPLTVLPGRGEEGSKGRRATPSPARASETALLVILDAGWRLEISAAVDPALLDLVLSALQRLAK